MKQAIRTRVIAGLAAAVASTIPASAHDHHGDAGAVATPVFLATTAKPFDALMADAMAVMEDGMAHASMNGQQEHDFVTMMIPHHQGAIDMAKALLLRTSDPALRNMAQGILAEQQIEIQLLRQWLDDHPAASMAAHPMKGHP